MLPGYIGSNLDDEEGGYPTLTAGSSFHLLNLGHPCRGDGSSHQMAMTSQPASGRMFNTLLWRGF